MDVTKPYKCIGFGAMDVTKPYESIGLGARWALGPGPGATRLPLGRNETALVLDPWATNPQPPSRPPPKMRRTSGTSDSQFKKFIF
jgi:hypothetical protein